MQSAKYFEALVRNRRSLKPVEFVECLRTVLLQPVQVKIFSSIVADQLIACAKSLRNVNK